MLDIKNRETLEIYVLGDDFKFYQNLKYLPLTSYPSNNQSALIIYCLGGKAKITVHGSSSNLVVISFLFRWFSSSSFLIL